MYFNYRCYRCKWILSVLRIKLNRINGKCRDTGGTNSSNEITLTDTGSYRYGEIFAIWMNISTSIFRDQKIEYLHRQSSITENTKTVYLNSVIRKTRGIFKYRNVTNNNNYIIG